MLLELVSAVKSLETRNFSPGGPGTLMANGFLHSSPALRQYVFVCCHNIGSEKFSKKIPFTGKPMRDDAQAQDIVKKSVGGGVDQCEALKTKWWKF